MNKKPNLTTETLDVPCVKVVEQPPAGSKHFAGPYYPDELEKLRNIVRGLRPRERFVVAPVGEKHSVFKLPKAKA